MSQFFTKAMVPLDLGKCSSLSLQLPINYNVDSNVYVVLRDDGTYSKGTYTDPSTSATSRKCEITFIANSVDTGKLQKFFWENNEGYAQFNIDVFLNKVKGVPQKCKFSFQIKNRVSIFDYEIVITLELMP